MKKIKTKLTPCFRRWNRKGYAVFASLHRHVTIGVLCVTMSILLQATNAYSAGGGVDTTAVLKSMQIEGVGVVGRRSAPTRSAMSQTPLFDRKVEVAAPLHTLESALRLAPAVDIRERGGKGVQSDVFIRGGSFDQTMVMLNGVNFTDARTGHQSSSLPVDMDCISGIELIDGVAGVGAYAGAINVLTMPLMSNYVRLEAVGGQYGYGYGNLSGAIQKGRLSIFSAASYRRSDGYTHNTDFENYNGYIRAIYDSEGYGFFDFQAGYQDRAFGANGFYAAYNRDQYEQTSTALGSLRWMKNLGRFTMNSTVSYRKNLDQYDWTRGKAMNYHNTDNVGADFWVDYAWKGAGVSTIGADYTFNHIYSTQLGSQMSKPNGRYTHSESRQVGNVWVRHHKSFERFEVGASAGVSFTPYGNDILWGMNGKYRVAKGLSLDAGITQSMRLPTFTDLYYSSPAQQSNPNLSPEKAITYKIGVNYTTGNWRGSALSYYRAGRNIIDKEWHSDIEKWVTGQKSKLDTYGVELTGGYYGDGFLRRAVLSYSYIDNSLDSDAVTSLVLDHLNHKLSSVVEFAFLRNFRLAVTATFAQREGSYTSYFWDANGDLVVDDKGAKVSELREYDPHLLVDARLSWAKDWCRLYVDVSNLTNSHHQDFGGIPLPGRWLTGGAVFTFGR